MGDGTRDRYNLQIYLYLIRGDPLNPQLRSIWDGLDLGWTPELRSIWRWGWTWVGPPNYVLFGIGLDLGLDPRITFYLGWGWTWVGPPNYVLFGMGWTPIYNIKKGLKEPKKQVFSPFYNVGIWFYRLQNYNTV